MNPRGVFRYPSLEQKIDKPPMEWYNVDTHTTSTPSVAPTTPPPAFCEVASEPGICVMDEEDIETHGAPHTAPPLRIVEPRIKRHYDRTDETKAEVAR